MATFRGVSFEETFDDSPEETFAVDQGRAVRTYLTAWADRYDFVDAFLGTASVATVGSVTYLTREIPHQHPDTNFFATAIPKIVGIGPRGSDGADETLVAKYEKARIFVVYTAPMYDIRADLEVLDGDDLPNEGYAMAAGSSRYIIRTAKPGARLYVLGRGAVKTVDNGLSVPEGVAVTIPHIDLQYQWMHVPLAAVPQAAIREGIGKINDAVFDGFEAGTLLCETPDPVPITDQTGNRRFNITYRFRYLPNRKRTLASNAGEAIGTALGWNYVLKPTANGTELDFIKTTATGALGGPPLYESFDFTKFFRPTQ